MIRNPWVNDEVRLLIKQKNDVSVTQKNNDFDIGYYE